MKNTLFIILSFSALCFPTFGYGQVEKLDSLKRQLQIETDDSLVCVLTGNVGYYLASQNFDSSRYYLKKAISHAKNRGYTLLHVRFQCFLGMSNTINGELDVGINSFRRAIEIAQNGALDSAAAQAQFGLANVLESKGDFAAAIAAYQNALIYFEAHGYTKAIIGVKANLSVLYFSIGEPERAKPLILETNQYYKKHGLTQRLMNGYQRLASVFEHEGRSDSALHYLKISRDIATSLNNLFSLSVIENHLGNSYLSLGQVESARDAYEKSVKYKRDLGEESEEYLKTYANLAYCYVLQNKPLEARKYLALGAELLPGIETKKFVVHFYKMHYKIDSVEGNHLNALSYFQKYTALKDSLINQEKSKQLAEIETKYETEKKEGEIRDLSQQAELQSLLIRKQQTQLLVLVLVILIIGASLYFYLKHRRLRQKQLTIDKELAETRRRLNLERQYKKSEVKAIKAQMNPHFLFNALNSIQDLILLKDIRSSNEYLGKFADLMRKTLEASGKDQISVLEELTLLGHYLELEKLRFGEDFHYDLKSETVENPDIIQIPPLLIQPYVENAIKHGLLHKKGKKKLMIDFKWKESVLMVEVVDNGIGRKKAQEIRQRRADKHLSFSTEQNDRRIELINETSAHRVGLKVEDLFVDGVPAGTRVILSFSDI